MNKMKIKNFSLFLFLFLIPVSICNDNFIKDASTNSIKDNELQNDERTFLKDYWDEVELPTIYKRAPSQAFFGVRGKKEQIRGPSGFLGVRGKKNYNYIESDSENNIDEPSDYMDEYYESQVKRKPQGFVGLRGKKSETPEFIKKRVPVTGFFGMRGKKEPFTYQSSSGYIGVRKKPSLPFMKFVGVRGKKAVKRDTRHLRLAESNENMFEGFRTIQRRADTPPDKSIGFIGMRG